MNDRSPEHSKTDHNLQDIFLLLFCIGTFLSTRVIIIKMDEDQLPLETKR